MLQSAAPVVDATVPTALVDRATPSDATNPSASNSVPVSNTSQTSYRIPVNSIVHRILNPQREMDLSNTSSSDSEFSSSSDSSDAEVKKRKKKERKHAHKKKLQRRKLEQQYDRPVEPTTYNGDPNYKKFEQFVSQLVEFFKACHIRKDRQVRRTQFFLRGKALDFYMTHVQLNEKEWKLERFLAALFDHCFPQGFRVSQRKKLAECKQNGRALELWIRELKDLARIIGNIPEDQMVVYLWEGADRYIAAKWAENGFNPEVSTTAELEESAERYELAEKIRRQTTNNEPSQQNRARYDNKRSTHCFDSFSQRSDSKPYPSHRSNDHKSAGDPKTNAKGNWRKDYAEGNRDSRPSKPQASNGGRVNMKDDKGRKKRTPDELNELRSKGACFECEQVGHQGKDCPRRTRVKPPSNLIANAARLQELDQLTDINRAFAISALAVTASQDSVDEERSSSDDEGSESDSARSYTSGLPELIDVSDMDSDSDDEHEVSASLPSNDSVGLENIVQHMDDEEAECLRCHPKTPTSEPTAETTDIEPDSDTGSQEHEDLSQLRLQDVSMIDNALSQLRASVPFIYDFFNVPHHSPHDPNRFYISYFGGPDSFLLMDHHTGDDHLITREQFENSAFNFLDYILKEKARVCDMMLTGNEAGLRSPTPPRPAKPSIEDEPTDYYDGNSSQDEEDNDNDPDDIFCLVTVPVPEGAFSDFNRSTGLGPKLMGSMAISLFGASAKPRKLSESAPEILERNAATPKDFIRKSPRSIVIEVEVNGHMVCVLLDTGSRADFISSNLADQLKLKLEPLAKPLTVQLAVSGSKSKVNYSVDVQFAYQDINEHRRFDVLNVDGYDLILGTPFLFQHQVMMTMNPSQISIGSTSSLP